MRKASIKETGEELSPAEWARFDAAVARLKAERAAQENEGEVDPSRDARRAREPAECDPGR